MEQAVSEDKGKAGQEVTLSVMSADLEVELRQFTLDSTQIIPKTNTQTIAPQCYCVGRITVGVLEGGRGGVSPGVFSRRFVVLTLEEIPPLSLCCYST